MPVLIAQKLDCMPVLCERCDCRGAVRQDNRIEQHRRHCLKRDIDLNRVTVARRDCSEPHADEPRNCPGIAERLVNGDQLFAGDVVGNQYGDAPRRYTAVPGRANNDNAGEAAISGRIRCSLALGIAAGTSRIPNP